MLTGDCEDAAQAVRAQAEIATAVSTTYAADPNFASAASVPLAMIADVRRFVGASNVFGNMFTGVEMLVQPSPAGAGDIRKALASLDGDSVRWVLGQGYNMAFQAKVLMNSWCRSLDLSALSFAGPVGSIMLGAPMMAQRASMMAPAGTSYCIALPTPDGGVKVAAVLAEAAANVLQAKPGGPTVTITRAS